MLPRNINILIKTQSTIQLSFDYRQHIIKVFLLYVFIFITRCFEQKRAYYTNSLEDFYLATMIKWPASMVGLMSGASIGMAKLLIESVTTNRGTESFSLLPLINGMAKYPPTLTTGMAKVELKNGSKMPIYK